MAVEPGMFLFEVVVQNVQTLSDSRQFVIRSDFADVFSLELKDPKQMHIVMPDPPPLPPDPPGKKKKPKPKPKKGKKGAIELPPPEPVIQSGQSVLFTSTPEFLIQSMRNFPMEVSLWSKEDNLSLIGSNSIPWDPKFVRYLERICNSEDPPPISINDDYNIFEEGKPKRLAKLGIQVKLSFLKDKVTMSFRTLSEDTEVRKYLYTGINSKTTSYICNMKTTDEIYIENSNKVENNFEKDRTPKKVVFADYKNAPGANLTFFNEGDYCCMGHADKPPESIYKSPQTLPDIDTIIDYVRTIIVSCNDNMRMLTPRPTIRPRVKATDMDRLCYCKETQWPKGEFADRFKKEAQKAPCALCSNTATKRALGEGGTTFDVANIRGPCGRADCRIARDLRAYIENLVEEDLQEVKLDDIIGPCGSRSCLLAEKIQEFICHQGPFSEGETEKALSTQCACIKKMQESLLQTDSCNESCQESCNDSDTTPCAGSACPSKKNINEQVYNVFYFTVEYENAIEITTPKSGASGNPSSNTSEERYCDKDCGALTKSSNVTSCAKNTCSSTANDVTDEKEEQLNLKCVSPICPNREEKYPDSPADSNIEIKMKDIHNMCCVKTCEIGETVKQFLVDGYVKKSSKSPFVDDNPCYCDCVCSLKFTKKTTYCPVCGGYECLGEDLKDQPEFAMPYPCPVYHKLYDKKYIKVNSPWPEEEDEPERKAADTASIRSGRSEKTFTTGSKDMSTVDKGLKPGKDAKKKIAEKKEDKSAKAMKQVGKFTAKSETKQPPPELTRPESKYPYPLVPRNKGWAWEADDIPAMKVRPQWKPGAAHKLLVRKYRSLREGMDVIMKKKRALMSRKKKLEMKPTLIVKKLDGEYTVQMEVFKKYSKERLICQYPFEEKPPLIYTIGKTDEEKYRIQRIRERRERRETRRKARIIQSAFRDRCQEICVKAYNQAIGLLPLPNPNSPECPCDIGEGVISPPIDSCSCSEENSYSSSDTDGDDWVIEFSAPASRWDAKAKPPPVMVDNESQYTYLDYRVKLVDKRGKELPRFFKGPDGKQECSDLGGFWGTGHEWMEINKDGYIGPDNRWVPMNFTGPDGMFYSAEDGFFTDNTGQTLKIGIDGYIDKDNKWCWYGRRKRPGRSKSTLMSQDTKKNPRMDTAKLKTTDPKGKTKQEAPPAAGSKPAKDNKSKKNVTISGKSKNPLVMSLSVNFERQFMPRLNETGALRIDPMKLGKYKEIMNDLEMYDLHELKPPKKTNRASNTPRKKFSTLALNSTYINHKPLAYANRRTYDVSFKNPTIKYISPIARSINSSRTNSVDV